MKVLKFGGSSVGSAQGLSNIKRIAEKHTSPIVVVVSALGGITDALLDLSDLAATNSPQYPEKLEAIRQRHHDAIRQSVPEQAQIEVLEKADQLLDQLGAIVRGVSLVEDLSPKTSASIVAYGERLSSLIVSHVLNHAQLIDAREIIKTEPYFNRHIVDFQITNSLIRKYFEQIPAVTVIGGFISSDRDNGATTNLGRGGSDYTAAIVAAAMEAEQLEIYTDVDGFMTADPRIVDKAYLIEHLTYVESMELCNFGAKVIYAPTIFPAYNRSIPIVIKNTYNLDCQGTYISRRSAARGSEKLIKGISSINDTSLLTIHGRGSIGAIGLNYRISKCLAKAGVSVFIVSKDGNENAISIGVRSADAKKATTVIRDEFSQEIALGQIGDITTRAGLATVAIVGENMRHIPGIAGKLFRTLAFEQIEIIAYAQGASETNISFVVDYGNLNKTLNTIHESFFMSDLGQLNVFIAGANRLSDELRELITKKQRSAIEQSALKINMFDLGDLCTNQSGDCSNTAAVKHQDTVQTIERLNVINPVLVDCSTNGGMAQVYEQLLSSNISVVTANKTATSSDYSQYRRIKQSAKVRGVKYLFDTVVGAGLPVISTITDLRSSGDTNISIKAAISTTINYIFNTLSTDIPFSQAVRMACGEGYAESDPRTDLNGTDTIRKLVLLAREAGYEIEREEIVCQQFIGEHIFEGSIQDFLSQLDTLDRQFSQRHAELAKKGKKLCYIATVDNGKCSIGLEEVDSRSPFYHSHGGDNIVLISSARYREYPLQLRGYGATPDSKAAGLLADVMSIVNSK